MVGFTLALAGVHEGRPFLHSHMTAVLESFRDRGVGRKLKLFQRDDALARGFQLVEWTFDPLELKNAHFNFMRLGAIARRFIPNCYGVTESPLHAGMPTDRLVAEWWLDSPRVNSLLSAAAPAEGHAHEAQPQSASLSRCRHNFRAPKHRRTAPTRSRRRTNHPIRSARTIRISIRERLRHNRHRHARRKCGIHTAAGSLGGRRNFPSESESALAQNQH